LALTFHKHTGAGYAAAEKFQRLLDLITFNYSYNCFQAIRRAKVDLSTRTQTSIDIPELNLTVPFSRAQLDAILAPVLARTRECVDTVLARACREDGFPDRVPADKESN
jgi:molecular chaperone DnaK (HSP70)